MNQDLSLSLRDSLSELLSPDPDKNDEEDLPCDADTAGSPPSPATPVLRAPSPSPLLTEPKKYEEEDLPWDMNITYPHPTLDDENISSAADMPHGVKKQVNAIENSGKKSSDRDLHLNGLPVQLRMAYDAYN